MMGLARNWTPEEYQYLEENWGKYTIPQLAKKLNRSNQAVRIKIVRRGLGRAVNNANCLNARQTSDLMGVDIHTVTDYWIAKCGLKSKLKAPYGEKNQYFIDFEDLIKWLKNNQNLWDSRKIEIYALGKEFDWLVHKRKSDIKIPKRRFQKWTANEDAVLIKLFKTGKYTYKQIGEAINRSENSVERRISRLDVWGTGRYIGDKAKRKKQDNAKMLENFWQKDTCEHWDGYCTKNGTNCDECTFYQRVKEQFCKRCGSAFYERKENALCSGCRTARKKQAQKKYAALHRKGLI